MDLGIGYSNDGGSGFNAYFGMSSTNPSINGYEYFSIEALESLIAFVKASVTTAISFENHSHAVTSLDVAMSYTSEGDGTKNNPTQLESVTITDTWLEKQPSSRKLMASTLILTATEPIPQAKVAVLVVGSVVVAVIYIYENWDSIVRGMSSAFESVHDAWIWMKVARGKAAKPDGTDILDKHLLPKHPKTKETKPGKVWDKYKEVWRAKPPGYNK